LEEKARYFLICVAYFPPSEPDHRPSKSRTESVLKLIDFNPAIVSSPFPG
jgi:hypothetical protein